MSDRFAFTLGGRYTNDEKRLRGETLGEYDWTWNPAPGQTFKNKESWGEFTWRAAVDFQPVENVMIYGSVSTGFRSGAYDMAQADPALIGLPVDPETVTNYEIGLKSRFLDNRAQLNIAAFDTTYEDLQFYVNAVGAGGSSATTNAGEATVQGVEVEFSLAITEGLILDLAWSNQDGDSKDIPVEAEIPEGTPPQGTIPNTYLASLNYRKALQNEALFYFNIDYMQKDEYSLEFIDNSLPQFRSKVDGMLNANIGISLDNGWDIQIWGKNLQDEDVVLYGQDFWFSLYGASLGNEELFNASFGPRYVDPRTYGVAVRYRFQ